MAITTLDGVFAAPKQRVRLSKTTTRPSIALIPFSVFDIAGNPGAGVLAGVSTTTGTVPTDATVGTAPINAFGGGATGYISRIDVSNTVASRILLFDMLWKGGAYAFNANTAGQAPTSFSSRVPGGTDFSGLELWYEQAAAATGIQSVNVTYTNQSGVAARSTGTVSQGTAGTIGRMIQLPLQAGDSGLQGVTGVVGSVATVGTFNILVMRPLGEVRIRLANDSVLQDILAAGMPVVFADSALVMVVIADSINTGLPEMHIDVING